MGSNQINKSILDNDKCFHCREMIIRFIKNKPQIQSISLIKAKSINKVYETGDISFSICLEEMGFEKKSVIKYEKEFFSEFMIDFFGEFLVRENISKFVEITSKIESQEFIKIISSKVHKKFGISVHGNVVTFIFHASLLPKILTEDLKSLDWK